MCFSLLCVFQTALMLRKKNLFVFYDFNKLNLDFHLPPVPAWTCYPQKTLFGLACYRQIDATVFSFHFLSVFIKWNIDVDQQDSRCNSIHGTKSSCCIIDSAYSWKCKIQIRTCVTLFYTIQEIYNLELKPFLLKKIFQN